MNRRRVIAILVAILLTLFGTAVLIAYVNSAEERAQEGTELVRILVATEEIAAGTPASDIVTSVAPREVPGSMRAEDAVTNIEGLGGQVALERILSGEPIVERQFGRRSGVARAGQPQIDEGREVITVALESQRALGGQIASGDLVGVIVSLEGSSNSATDETETTGCNAETAMVLAGVRVTDVGGGADPETGEGAGGPIMVSLDVDQPDAERIAFAAEYGSIWLTRQTDESRDVDERRQSCDNIFE